MKKLFYLLMLLAVISFSITSCKPPSQGSDKKLARETEKMMQEANKEIGMPAIKNFQEKKIMKQIYELRDQENLICYAYLFNERTGNIGQFIGKCVGYGLPYSTQFSNPEKLVRADMGNYTGDLAMPQPEPNGLFMPEGLNATWLLLIDPKTGTPRPVYIEPQIIVSPFPLNNTKN